MPEEAVQKSNVNLIKKVIVIAGVAFLIIMFFMVIKILNQETCGRETYTDYDFNGNVNSVRTLDSTNSYALINNPYEHIKNIKEFNFCFTTNSTEATIIEIISTERTYETIVIGEGYNEQCHFVTFPKNDSLNYIGLRCPSCSQSTVVTLYQGLIGEDVSMVHYNGTVNEFTGKSFDWVLNGQKNCLEAIKFFSFGYLMLIIMLGLIIGLIFGTEKIREVLYSDW